ncbi:unnamed protein product, partial [Meganyctiphanes norvegica]
KVLALAKRTGPARAIGDLYNTKYNYTLDNLLLLISYEDLAAKSANQSNKIRTWKNPSRTWKNPSSSSSTSLPDSLLGWLRPVQKKLFCSDHFEKQMFKMSIHSVKRSSSSRSAVNILNLRSIGPTTYVSEVSTTNRSKAISPGSLSAPSGGLHFTTLNFDRNSMAVSTGDINHMSKSIASFHLTGKKTMNTSVDRLFDADNVFTSSSYGDLPTIIEKVGGSGGVSGSGPKPPPRSRSPDKSRQSTDSLNKPALSEKSEKEIREEKPSTPPALPPKTSPPPSGPQGPPPGVCDI